MEYGPLSEQEISCPYCGETFVTLLDPGAGDSTFIEDCPVCCRPIELTVFWPMDGGPPMVQVAREDD